MTLLHHLTIPLANGTETHPLPLEDVDPITQRSFYSLTHAYIPSNSPPLPYVHALLKDLGDSRIYHYSASHLFNWLHHHSNTNPLTHRKIDSLSYFLYKENRFVFLGDSSNLRINTFVLSLYKAENGDDPSLFYIAGRLFDGDIIPRDLPQAIHYLTHLASKGHLIASACLGICFFHGAGVEQNDAWAAYYLKKPAEEDIHLTPIFFSELLFHGRGVEKNVEEGLNLLKKAAESCEHAQMRLANLFLKGSKDVDRNVSEGMRYLKCAAEKSFPAAQFLLASCLLRGENGEKKNPEEGLRYMKLSAEGNDLRSQHTLAILLLEGKEGVKKNLQESLHYARILFEKKSFPSLEILTKYLAADREEKYGSSSNGPSSQKERHLPTLLYHALTCFLGWGKERNLAEAKCFFQLAAQEKSALAEAIFKRVEEGVEGIDFLEELLKLYPPQEFLIEAVVRFFIAAHRCSLKRKDEGEEDASLSSKRSCLELFK